MERVTEISKPHEHAARQARDTAPAGASLSPVLDLQQQAGNQAVQQLLRSSYIQAKLPISNADDPEERQADQVAQTIMRKPAGFPAPTPCSCSHDGEMCEECQQKQSQPTIQRRASAPCAPAHVPRLVSDVLRSPGHPLDSATRAFFEPRFGRDFSHVRVHREPEADRASQHLHANAFTVGQHIYFRQSLYAPETREGCKLLAHELTHTLQQPAVPAATPDALPLTAPSDPSEREAEAMADNVISGSGGRFLTPMSIGSCIQGDWGSSSQAGNQPSAAQPKDSQPIVDAERITPQDYFALTGVPADILPEGVLVKDLNTISSSIRNAPVDTLPPGLVPSAASSVKQELQAAGAGAALAVPSPISLVPGNATGIMWVQGHLSVFANVDGALTIRGFRGNVAYYAGEMIPGPVGEWFSQRLNLGVSGAFRNDILFPKLPGRQTVIYVPTDKETAAAFRDELKATEYEQAYKYSPPSPQAERPKERRMYDFLKARTGEATAVVCSNNCTTVPVKQIEDAIGMHPQVDTPAGKLDVVTGRTAGGAPDPYEAGRGKRMKQFMEAPDLTGAKPGAARIGMTPGASKALGAVRIGGGIWMIYGGIESAQRLIDAIGTDQLPRVAAEEAATWGGGIAGAELGGSISAGIGESVFLVSGTEVSALFVVGGVGLAFGLGYLGALAGRSIVSAVLNFPEAMRALGRLLPAGMEALQTVGAGIHRLEVGLFLRPLAVRHESINPANWDLRSLPPPTAGAVYNLGAAAWNKLGSLNADDFLTESLKTFAGLGVQQGPAAWVSQALEAVKTPITPQDLLGMAPLDFVHFLVALKFLRFVRDPEVLADNQLFPEGHKVDEMFLNVRMAPMIGMRASINPNNWDLGPAGSGGEAILQVGSAVWQHLRQLDMEDFEPMSELPLAKLGVSKAMALAAAKSMLKPIVPFAGVVEGEDVPEEEVATFAEGLLAGTATDFVNRLRDNKVLNFRQEPGALASVALRWLRAGYQPW